MQLIWYNIKHGWPTACNKEVARFMTLLSLKQYDTL